MTTRLQQLDEIKDLADMAADVDDVARAIRLLVAYLKAAPRTTHEELLQLVREAVDLLNNPDSPLDVRDWLRAAARFVGPITPLPRAYDIETT
jgi:hypothetical protein